MALTTSNHMINPQVMGPMINAKIEALAKLTPYARVDTTLQGVPGDTRTVPSWAYIGDAEDVGEGEEVGLTTMQTSSSTFTIKKAMKAVGITQEAVNSGLGNPIGQAELQLAKSIVGKVDNDILDEVYKSRNLYAPSSLSAIAYDGIVEAVTQFEDEEEDVDKVMFIHPKQETTILKDPSFLSADRFEAGVAVRGAIGRVAGCWVKKSRKVKLISYEKDEAGAITIVADTAAEDASNKRLSMVQPGCAAVLTVGDKVNAVAAANQYYLCPILKLEPESPETECTEDELAALTIFLKKDTSIDAEWMPKKQQTDITACKYYGVALTNEAKVILAKFKK